MAGQEVGRGAACFGHLCTNPHSLCEQPATGPFTAPPLAVPPLLPAEEFLSSTHPYFPQCTCHVELGGTRQPPGPQTHRSSAFRPFEPPVLGSKLGMSCDVPNVKNFFSLKFDFLPHRKVRRGKKSSQVNPQLQAPLLPVPQVTVHLVQDPYCQKNSAGAISLSRSESLWMVY